MPAEEAEKQRHYVIDEYGDLLAGPCTHDEAVSFLLSIPSKFRRGLMIASARDFAHGRHYLAWDVLSAVYSKELPPMPERDDQAPPRRYIGSAINYASMTKKMKPYRRKTRLEQVLGEPMEPILLIPSTVITLWVNFLVNWEMIL